MPRSGQDSRRLREGWAPVASPDLIVQVGGTKWTLRAGASYRVGRDPQSEIVVGDDRVSWHHAVFRAEDGAWFVQDSGSTNGTFAGSRRIGRFKITGDCTLRVGNAIDGPAVVCSVPQPVAPRRPPAAPGPPPSWPATGPSPWSRVDLRPTATMRAPARTLRIGRAEDNDIVLADLSVSRHHAELRNIGGRYEMADLDSHNGTFLNGMRVFRAPVTEQDIVGIGPATFRLVGDELRQFIDRGDVSLVAQDLTVQISGKVLLDHVSFPIGERSLVAVIGPSGAGKTTLLNALTGIRPATEGAVLYDNRDLYAHYAELRHRIGLVPQEDVIYQPLTPRRSLGYAAELRFPGDTSSGERRERVQEVIDELKLMETTKERPEPAADTQTASLSGGEKKRVSIALELLTKPSVLFLDEPTSSLDVELKEEIVASMRDLANEGRTIIMVTHDLEYLGKCDRVLVLLPGGKMAFYGPSDEGLRYFGKTRWADVYRAFRAEPDRGWAGEFRRSSCYRQYVASGPTGQVAQSARSAARPPPAPRSRPAQLVILCRRYVALIAADRGFLIWLAALPIVLGALIGLSAKDMGLAGPDNRNAPTTLLFLVIVAAFTGGFSSVRELIKERPMYLRERAVGLSAGAYLLSKVAVLGFIAAVQAVLLVAVGVAWARPPSGGAFLRSMPLAELMLGVAVLAVVSMTLGLVVSALVSSSDKTMTILVMLSIGQVMLSGAVLTLTDGLKPVSYLAPARWGFAATAATVDLTRISPSSDPKLAPDPLWAHKPSIWLLAMAMEIVLATVFTLIAWWSLIRISPGHRRHGAKRRTRNPELRADGPAASRQTRMINGSAGQAPRVRDR